MPEGWYHATVNLDETIAIAGQSFVKGPVTKELQLSLRWAMTQDYDDLLRLERFHLDQLQHTHRGIAGMAASTLRDLGRHEEAYRRLEDAIDLNPKHADSYTNRGQFMLLDAMCGALCVFFILF